MSNENFYEMTAKELWDYGILKLAGIMIFYDTKDARAAVEEFIRYLNSEHAKARGFISKRLLSSIQNSQVLADLNAREKYEGKEEISPQKDERVSNEI